MKIQTAKSFIIDVWYGTKYIPKVMEDSKINLKRMNTKMLEKIAFLQCGPCRGYPHVGISQGIRSSTSHLYYYVVVLKNLAIFTAAHLHRSLFSTCNLQLHWKRDAGTYSFLWVLRTLLLWKPPANWIWKENFTKNGEPTFLL